MVATPVKAHPESSPSLVNRYVTLAAHGAHTEISVALLYGDQPALLMRRAADSNRDGVLGGPELEQLKSTFQEQAAQWLYLQLQGHPLVFVPTVRIELGSNSKVAASPVVVEARMMIELPNGPHSFTLRPGLAPEFLGETEVACTLGPQWRLDASSSPTDVGRSHSHKLVGKLPDSWQVRFDLQPSYGLRDRARDARLSLLLLAFAVVTGVSIWFLIKRKQRS